MPDLDHRFMRPPFLRVAQSAEHHGVSVYQWDLRLAQPNVSHLELATVHSFEHFLGVSLRGLNPQIVTVAPMGCSTGFYITAIDIGEFEEMAALVAAALREIVRATVVPLADVVHCGWAQNHHLIGAQNLAAWLLDRVEDWSQTGSVEV
jgi:S-ribosylhomocysteine lyase